MNTTYTILNKDSWQLEEFSIVPIRFEDRHVIMQWRNEQMYHLRQAAPLTEENQNKYFTEVLAPSFNHDKPSQILFSFLKNKECIGYGGLVHIGWEDKRAEISFIMKTELEALHFSDYWQVFLKLIQQVAFDELNLHKIFTYAFDLRPHLYPALESVGFRKEAVLPEHCRFDGRFLSVVIHGKVNRKIVLRPAIGADAEVTHKWANDAEVRRFSLTKNKIPREDHLKWFENKLSSESCLYFIAECNADVVGSFRLDLDANATCIISYLLDPAFHGLGLGEPLLVEGIKKAKLLDGMNTIVGHVLEGNKPSMHLFKKLGFKEQSHSDGVLKFELELK